MAELISKTSSTLLLMLCLFDMRLARDPIKARAYDEAVGELLKKHHRPEMLKEMLA